jgi:hypothetical protein
MIAKSAGYSCGPLAVVRYFRVGATQVAGAESLYGRPR